MRKVGILGAGYIASHHVHALKALKGIEIVGVCDVNLNRAKELTQNLPGAQAYSSLEEMLDKTKPTVVHILTPPDHHFETSEKIIKRGIHLFLEKPMAVNSKQCQALNTLAEQNRVRIGVNHNFLFYSSYLKLKKALAEKQLGRLDQITITWQKNLDQIQRGPYGIWMLNEPQNLWLETGPHLCALLLDLAGSPEAIHYSEAGSSLQLPTEGWVYRRWTVIGKAKNICFEMRLALNPGFEEKSIELRGQAGSARVDFERDTFLIKRHTCSSVPFDLYCMNKNETHSLFVQGRQYIQNYIKSKFKFVKFGDPYAASIAKSVSSFYENLNGIENSSLTGSFGQNVMEICEQVLSKTEIKSYEKKPSLKNPSTSADILVLGGTGFIGQVLTKRLVEQGYHVRVLARDPDKLAQLSAGGSLDLVKGDLLQRETLDLALKGIKKVFHLATAHVKSWKDYLDKDVNVTNMIGEACLTAGAERLLYTGTIDSYFAGGKGDVINEKTSLDPKIHRRNYYAQAKALGEQTLEAMHAKQGLPLVIARPGIVLGQGGSPFHWGVGMWHYETSCQLWGEGNHPLPFVLVEDVAEGLILAMEKENIEGQSFNLVDNPCLTAQEYVQAIEEALEAKINTFPTPILKFYSIEYFKWIVKVMVNHKERRYPSWRDWSSRTQSAIFDCSKARSILEWKPASSKDILVEEGIQKPARSWWS
jgi:nucleoside-diphosphate-sugar epimerase/predicted dehydrogenase